MSNTKFDLEKWITDHNLEVKRTAPWQGGHKWILKNCVWNPDHKNDSAFIVQFSNGAIDAGCLHTSCREKNWQALLEAVDPDWRKNAPGKSDLKKSKPLVFTLLADLMREEDEKVAWLVEGLLPSAGFSLAVAKPKVGKSTLARNLAFCVATGTPFLGRRTTKGTVLYLALEEKRGEIKKHFRSMGATGDEEIYIFASTAPQDVLVQVKQAIQEKHPVLLIIDPLFRFTRIKDANDYAQTTAALEPVLELARESGAHVIATHHSPKAEKTGGDEVLGSTAILGSVDTSIFLKRSPSHVRSFYSIQRYGSDMEETLIAFDQETGVIDLGLTKPEAESARMEDSIYEFLSQQEESIPEKEIEVSGKREYKVKALRSLTEKGRVARAGKGGKGDPFQYSAVPDSGSQVPDIGKEHGNNKNETANTSTTDSCSQVPLLDQEHGNNNVKKEGNAHKQTLDSGSHQPSGDPLTDSIEKLRETVSALEEDINNFS